MGVGSLIKEGLSLLRIPTANCDCAAKAKEWDNAGVDWCEANQAEIVEHLRQAAERRKLPFPESIVARCVSMAIARAREEEAYQDMEYEHKVIAAIQAFQRPPDIRPKGWEWREECQDAMKRYLEAQSAYELAYPGGHDGHGIVVLGGGKYFACGWVLCRMLRMLGCTLPIEFWYVDAHELDHYQQGLLRELGAEPVTLSERTDRRPRVNGGWEHKIWSIMFSRFREVLFLDADQVPACDVSSVFDDSEYREHGLRLWPDLLNDHGWDVTDQAFRICGLPVPDGRLLQNGRGHTKSTGYRPIESGQILVDKSRCWRTLEMVRTLNDQSDFWFRTPPGEHKWFIYGDKSTWLLAAGMTGQQYAMGKDCTWFGDHVNGGGFTQYIGEQPVWQHRCNPASKIRVSGRLIPREIIREAEFHSAFDELKRRWSGTIWRWQDQGADDLAVAKQQIGDWVSEGLPPIKELRDGGKTDQPRYTWRIVHEGGEPLLVVVDGYKAVAFLGHDRQCWVNNGVSLKQAPPKWLSCDRNLFDLMVWSETTNNDYRLPDALEGQTVLDLGAHVGMFAHACVQRGASRVVCVEPWAPTFRHLAANAAHIRGVEPIAVAVGWTQGFQRMTTAGDSGIGMFSDAGAVVPTVPLDALLREVGRVDLLKLDIEGAEWPVLFHSHAWREIPTIIGEYHMAEIDWWSAKFPASVAYTLDNLRALLAGNGYTVEIQPNPADERIGLFWARR